MNSSHARKAVSRPELRSPVIRMLPYDKAVGLVQKKDLAQAHREILARATERNQGVQPPVLVVTPGDKQALATALMMMRSRTPSFYVLATEPIPCPKGVVSINLLKMSYPAPKTFKETVRKLSGTVIEFRASSGRRSAARPNEDRSRPADLSQVSQRTLKKLDADAFYDFIVARNLVAPGGKGRAKSRSLQEARFLGEMLLEWAKLHDLPTAPHPLRSIYFRFYPSQRGAFSRAMPNFVKRLQKIIQG